jgi:lipopolysaccharide biosynthesis regulator YciM
VSDDPIIAEHLSDVYARLGQRDKAIDVLHQSIDLEKKDDRKKVLEEKLRSLEQKRK